MGRAVTDHGDVPPTWVTWHRAVNLSVTVLRRVCLLVAVAPLQFGWGTQETMPCSHNLLRAVRSFPHVLGPCLAELMPLRSGPCPARAAVLFGKWVVSEAESPPLKVSSLWLALDGRFTDGYSRGLPSGCVPSFLRASPQPASQFNYVLPLVWVTKYASACT